ncbi:hypothetical protein [Candidatus Nanosynbacter lyticus]|jgi:hypothetical protein|nr:hypothetical protein [Candidatus Nanosynbacter lyticus]
MTNWPKSTNEQVFEDYHSEIMSSWATASADEDGLVYVPEK